MNDVPREKSLKYMLGRAMLIAMAGGTLVAIPVVFWFAYYGARTCDGLLGWMTLGGLRFFFTVVWPFVLLIALIPLLMTRSVRWAAVIGALLLLLLVGFLGGKYLGQRVRDREFEQNRQVADAAVRAIESYRVKHGEYPTTLEDIQPPVVTELRREDVTYRLDYKTSMSDSYTLSYEYGWGRWEWYSKAGKWELHIPGFW